LEKVDNTFEVQLWAQNVEEDILTVALVEFRYNICHLILHGKGTGCVGKAGDHLAYRGLKGEHLLLQVFILLFQGVPFFPNSCEFLCYGLDFLARLDNLLLKLS
jgi:hypothetical protein